jgi:hypothetical protein
MSNQQKELDLEAIEATLNQIPRIPHFPAYFNDMRLLVAEVRKLRDELEQSEREAEHFARLSCDDLGKNPPVWWKDKADELQVENERLKSVEETNRVLRQTIDSMATERLQLLKEVEQLRAT